MAGMLEYKCPCCDGAIQFDSATQKMKCPYCDTEFDVDTLKGYDEELKDEKPSEMEWTTPGGSWAEGETAGLHTYSCKSCGGEIVGDDTMAASACPFCGNPIVLTGQFAGALRPDLIIPFKLDKKAAKAKLQEHLKGKTLLPRVFRSQNHIDEIKGVYVPFWLFDSDADAQLRFTATRTRCWSDSKYDIAHFAVDTEEDGLQLIRKLLSFLPQNNLEETPLVECKDPIDRLDDVLNDIIPDNANQSYDMYEVIGTIVDNNEFLEVHADYAKNIIVGFARFNGQSVGIVANQPKVMAGCLDSNASRKAGRFVRFCDAFNIPLVTLVDVPGFLPGTGQEYNGVILHGAKLLYAYGEATVPKITVTLRKSYGGAYCVMSSNHLRGDMNYAWPTAEIAVMGPSGAVEVIFAKEVAAAEDPKACAAEKEAEYKKAFANPYNAAQYGYIDDVIEPRNTRFRIIRALQQLQTKKLSNPAKKHDNLPL